MHPLIALLLAMLIVQIALVVLWFACVIIDGVGMFMEYGRPLDGEAFGEHLRTHRFARFTMTLRDIALWWRLFKKEQ